MVISLFFFFWISIFFFFLNSKIHIQKSDSHNLIYIGNHEHSSRGISSKHSSENWATYYYTLPDLAEYIQPNQSKPQKFIEQAVATIEHSQQWMRIIAMRRNVIVKQWKFMVYVALHYPRGFFWIKWNCTSLISWVVTYRFKSV